MTDRPPSTVESCDLPIALYLNQRVTFDLLATLEDGFAHLTTVQESPSTAEQTDIQGGLGLSNTFALLGLTFGAGARRDSANASLDTTTEKLVHTPTSLFARLRKELIRRDLVRYFQGNQCALDGLSPGDFVEFEAVLRRSPVIGMLSNLREVAKIIEGCESVAISPGSKKSRRRSARNNQVGQTSDLVKQMNAVIESISNPKSEDLIAECGDALRIDHRVGVLY